MRRPPVLLSLMVLVLAMAACNDKITDSDEQRSTKTTPELIPFESTVPEPEPEPEPEATDPPDTGSEDSDAESDKVTEDTEPEDTEPEVLAIDPMPGDTATFDTRPEDDPLCKAAQKIVDANAKYQDVLATALDAASENPDALVKALRKLPLETLRNAYDDLSAELPQNLRREVATIRDFTLEHGRALAKVEDPEGLSELIGQIESDPNATKVTKATLNVSQYTEKECGIKISQGR